MEEINIEQTFEIAIAAEKTAERLFQGLATKFAYREEIARFWLQYAADEVKHAEWLRDLKARLRDEHLARPADVDTVKLLQAVSNFSLDEALKSVNDLEDAYQLIDNVENGETNAIFQFLINSFESNTQIRAFLRDQLDQHVERLSTGLPPQYQQAAARRMVKALELEY
jgi:hypothetical protein